MRFWLRPISWRPSLRKLCAAVTLVAYVLTVAGFPLSLVAAKDGRQPFPCQNHACGCQTPEQCWQHCCCSTLEQRLAWAREHGIEPPAYAQPSAALGWHATRLRDREEKNVCANACCVQKQPSKSHACCANSTDHAGNCEHHAGGERTLGSLPCKGMATSWISSGAVLPLTSAPAWNPHDTPTDWLSHPNISAGSFSAIPPDPPPR